MARTRSTQARRVELILQQIEEFPTLNSIAVRLLELTSSDTAQARDVIDLVAADPSLSAKVIKLCRQSNRMVQWREITVDRAVVLLGMDTIRSAVLSVQVFEALDGMMSKGREEFGLEPTFDRVMFWQHSLAVAVASEILAGQPGLRGRVSRAEAFLGGLLHDLGHLALYIALPKTFDRICVLAEGRNLSIDEACRRTIGIDTHTAAKRLAEHWRFPRELIDLLWLNGQSMGVLPELPHRELIATVTLADAIARTQLIAHPGHAPRNEDLRAMAMELDLSSDDVDTASGALHEQVSERGEALGIGEASGRDLLLQSINRANDIFRRRSEIGERLDATTRDRREILESVSRFLGGHSPGQSVLSTLAAVASSALDFHGDGRCAFCVWPEIGTTSELYLFSPQGTLEDHRAIPIPEEARPRSWHLAEVTADMSLAELAPWLADRVPWEGQMIIPLSDPQSATGVLLITEGTDGGPESAGRLDVLHRAWTVMIAASLEHDRNRRLGEQLAESNRSIVEMHDELARRQTLAALGEVAAGAAHEMNNPLTVISGRSQILADALDDPAHREMAQEIVRQTQCLTDLITSLHLYSEQPAPDPRLTDIATLIGEVIEDVMRRCPDGVGVIPSIPRDVPAIFIDPAHFAQVLRELLLNALEAHPANDAEVRVRVDSVDGADDRLVVQVIDDGIGLTTHAVAHAFDLFFSDKPAGRQPGLGLARARRLAEANHGRVSLQARADGGALATLVFEIRAANQAGGREAA